MAGRPNARVPKAAIYRRRAVIAAAITALGPPLPGSLVERRTTCGNQGCRSGYAATAQGLQVGGGQGVEQVAHHPGHQGPEGNGDRHHRHHRLQPDHLQQ